MNIQEITCLCLWGWYGACIFRAYGRQNPLESDALGWLAMPAACLYCQLHT